ncbi:MAG: hypothetical protein M1544_02615 [Candidatus Marsarchaeota archaeon]|nr:hypothetical protein [Candidatus Marsarchaeota archaeon]
MEKIKTNISKIDTYPKLMLALVLLELILSVVFLAIGYAKANQYFRGVGVGLAIACVTSAIAYFSTAARTSKTTA